MIQERTQSIEQHNDLFSNLISANETDDEGLKLNDQDLMGNIFIFLIGKLAYHS
jgi:cytochrome P450